jgi:hypothetical protein
MVSAICVRESNLNELELAFMFKLRVDLNSQLREHYLPLPLPPLI